MKIQNFNELAVTESRKKMLSIAEAGLLSIETERVLKNLVKINDDLLTIDTETFSLKKIKRIIFIGIGKSAVEAGIIFEKILGNDLTEGIVIDVKATAALKKITAFKGTHPLSSDNNVEATKKMVQLLESATKEDLVIFLISGGGSALLCLPHKGNVQDEISVFQGLTKAGATIQELNTVRKHLSLARGGWLAKYAYPAQAISLIFSDVPGNDITFIASGPTCKDTTTIEDAKKVLKKYAVDVKDTMLIETPKEEKYFKKVSNILALSNQTALLAMEQKAKELGFAPQICTNHLTGESGKVAKKIAEEIHDAPNNSVLLYGGETTVNIHGTGRGGRNLQLALSTLQYLHNDEMVITMASDGRDNGAIGGAISDIITKKAIEKSNLDTEIYLKNDNTYPLFEKIGNYLTMGDTGSNVSDLIIAMKI